METSRPTPEEILKLAAEYAPTFYFIADRSGLHILETAAETSGSYWWYRTKDAEEKVEAAMEAASLAADCLYYDINNLPENDPDIALIFRLATLGVEDLKKINARLFPLKYLRDDVLDKG